MKTIIFLAIAVALYSCRDNGGEKQPPEKQDLQVKTPVIGYSLKNILPHDTTAFTEGFLFHENQLFESTGGPLEMPQTSSLFGIVNLKTGRIDTKAKLDKVKYFGEGIAILNGKIYQLTYQNQKGFIYDAKTFKPLGEFTYANKEGWGMTTDKTHLIMSDGTDVLTWLDPQSFKVVKSLKVTDENGAVENLNELEMIGGYIYANIYTTNYIYKIDPATGKTVGKLDLGSLVADAKSKYPSSLELNGIAFDSATNKVLVTGKLWPGIYEIEFPR